MVRNDDADELVGWKQIASYLGVSIPTARMYHNEWALPVYRRGNRRYYAYRDELQEWKRSSSVGTSHQFSPEKKTLGEEPHIEPRAGRSRLPFKPGYWALLLMLPVVLAVWIFESKFQQATPTTTAVKGETLQVFDDHHRLLWRKDFPGLAQDAVEHIHFIRDVDGDNQPEIFLNFRPPHDAPVTGRLICLSSGGTVRWEFKYGREQTIRGRYFEPFYRDHHILPIVMNGEDVLLVVASHVNWYPTQVVLLAASSGELISEYWHPGYLESLALFDVGNDGKREILLGGVNNPGTGPGHPVLVALDVPFSRPALVDMQSFFAPANAVAHAYLLFPQIDAFKPYRLMSVVRRIQVQSPDRILLAVGALDHEFYLYLDEMLSLSDSRASDDLLSYHDKLYSQGLLDHRFREDEIHDWSEFVSLPGAPDGNSPDIQRLFPP